MYKSKFESFTHGRRPESREGKDALLVKRQCSSQSVIKSSSLFSAYKIKSDKRLKTKNYKTKVFFQNTYFEKMTNYVRETLNKTLHSCKS